MYLKVRDTDFHGCRLKNLLEILLGIFYIAANLVIALESEDETKICEIPLLNSESRILMQVIKEGS